MLGRRSLSFIAVCKRFGGESLMSFQKVCSLGGLRKNTVTVEHPPGLLIKKVFGNETTFLW